MNDLIESPIPELALAVLCGGESHRMGTAKALLDFDGEPMVLRTLSRLSNLCGGPHFVMAAADQELPPLPLAVQVLRDRARQRGPLEGIVLATQAASAHPTVTAIAVVGCDLPWLQSQLIRGMFDALAGDADVICVQDRTRRHPLVAIYRPGVWQTGQGRLSAGECSLHGLLGALTTQTVDLSFVREFDATLRSLVNVNTPDDYQRALRMLD